MSSENKSEQGTKIMFSIYDAQQRKVIFTGTFVTMVRIADRLNKNSKIKSFFVKSFLTFA